MLAVCRRRLELRPTEAALHYLVGRLLGNMQDILGARSCFDRAIALDPKLPWPYRGRGIYYLKKRQLLRARADFEQALALDPKRAVFLSDLGQVCHMTGQKKRGLRLILQAIQAESSNAEYRAAHATMLFQNGKLKQAIAEMRRTVALDLDRFKSYWFLAELLVQTGQVADAVRVYQQLIARQPSRERRVRAQARVETLQSMLRESRLNRIREARSVGQVRDFLESRDLTVRREAYKSLLARRHKSDLPTFYKGLTDEDAGVRVYCVRGLGEVGGPAVVADLFDAFRVERTALVRGAIAGAIGRKAKPKVIPGLARLMKHENSGYVLEQLAASLTLISGADPGVKLDSSRLESSRVEVAEAWIRWAKTNQQD